MLATRVHLRQVSQPFCQQSQFESLKDYFVASGSDASEGGANEGFASEDALQFFLNS